MMVGFLGLTALFAALFGSGLGLLSFLASRSSPDLEPLEGAQLMTFQLGSGLASGEYLTAWWARLLDSPWIAARFSSHDFAWVFFLISLGVLRIGLGQGWNIEKIAIAPLVYAVGCVLAAWIMYLRSKLWKQGLDQVSWCNMPSLTRQAVSRQQRWLLAQWRLATIAKLIVSVLFLSVIAALLVEHWPINNAPVDEHPDPL